MKYLSTSQRFPLRNEFYTNKATSRYEDALGRSKLTIFLPSLTKPQPNPEKTETQEYESLPAEKIQYRHVCKVASITDVTPTSRAAHCSLTPEIQSHWDNFRKRSSGNVPRLEKNRFVKRPVQSLNDSRTLKNPKVWLDYIINKQQQPTAPIIAIRSHKYVRNSRLKELIKLVKQ